MLMSCFWILLESCLETAASLAEVISEEHTHSHTHNPCYRSRRLWGIWHGCFYHKPGSSESHRTCGVRPLGYYSDTVLNNHNSLYSLCICCQSGMSRRLPGTCRDRSEIKVVNSPRCLRNLPHNFLFIFFDFIFIAHIIFNFICLIFHLIIFECICNLGFLYTCKKKGGGGICIQFLHRSVHYLSSHSGQKSFIALSQVFLLQLKQLHQLHPHCNKRNFDRIH